MYEINRVDIIELEKFPKVIINLYNVEDTKELINKWITLYEHNTPFSFIFDLTKLDAKFGDIGHGLLLVNFIKKIKGFRKINPDKYNLLRESIIVIKDKLSNTFIRSIFNLTTPLSNTYIVDSMEIANEIYNKINNNEEFNYKNVKLIKS